MSGTTEIWKGLQAGDSSALKGLYELYYQDLYYYGKRMTRDEHLVEDALQETFISFWKYRRTMSVPSDLRPFVLKAFRNHLMLLFKQRSGTAYPGEPLDFSYEVAFDELIIAGEDAQQLSARINEAIRQLTPRQREIIYYRFFENLSFEEIGVLMNMQTRATYKLAARALEALKKFMGSKTFSLFLYLVAGI